MQAAKEVTPSLEHALLLNPALATITTTTITNRRAIGVHGSLGINAPSLAEKVVSSDTENATVTIVLGSELKQRSAMQAIATARTVTSARPVLAGLAGHSGRHAQ